jgi:hypothetical protein
MLYDVIKKDLKDFMKLKDMDKVNAIRVIIGEFPRLNKLAGEIPTDDEVIKILKTLKKNEEIVLEARKENTSVYLNLINGYLPKTMSKQEIRYYIRDNIDVNTIVADIGKVMGQVMKSLKGKVDGKVVKDVLTEYKYGVFID